MAITILFYAILLSIICATSSFSPSTKVDRNLISKQLRKSKTTFKSTTTTSQQQKTPSAVTTAIPPTATSKPPHQFETTSNSNASAYDWSFISKAYVITCPNADPGSERLNGVRQILSGVGLIDLTTIKEFETDDQDRIRGCYSSHISVLLDAKDALTNGRNDKLIAEETGEWWTKFLPFANGSTKDEVIDGYDVPGKDQTKPVVLVMEDNLQLTGNLAQSILDKTKTFITSSQEWDVIHLSYTSYVPNFSLRRTSNPNIVQLFSGVGSALGTTAYLISEKGIDALLKDYEKYGYSAPIPDVMAKLFPASRYATYPTPFQRAPQTKSLVNPQLDYLRSVLFQPFLLSNVETVLVYTGLSTNALLPLTVVALIVSAIASLKITAGAGWELFTTGEYRGNVILPIVCSGFSIFSLWILAIGAALAPKQEQEEK